MVVKHCLNDEQNNEQGFLQGYYSVIVQGVLFFDVILIMLVGIMTILRLYMFKGREKVEILQVKVCSRVEIPVFLSI